MMSGVEASINDVVLKGKGCMDKTTTCEAATAYMQGEVTKDQEDGETSTITKCKFQIIKLKEI